MLFVEKLWNNNEYTVEIMSDTVNIKGLIMEKFSFSIKNSWSNWEQEFKQGSQGGSDALKDALKKVMIGASSLVGGEVSEFLSGLVTASKRQVYQTVVFWKDTDISGFGTKFLVINFDGKHNPKDVFKKLSELALPDREGFLLLPPHKYRVNVSLSVSGDSLVGGEGALGYRYSNWFFAKRYFVLGGVSCSFSDEKCRDGSPLYGEFTVDLVPVMEVNKDVFLSWLL